MVKIIIINGVGRSGKDEFVKQCRKYFANTHNISSVDNVKLIAQKMGWNDDKSDKGRKFLSDLKELWNNYNNGCTNGTFRRVAGIVENMEDYELDTLIFVHIREPEKIDEFKQLCKENLGINAKTMLVRNPNVPPIETNHSDGDVEKYIYDIYVSNSGTLEQLEDLARDFITTRFPKVMTGA